MKFSVIQGNIVSSTADAIIINLFEGVLKPSGATGAVDNALDGQVSTLIDSGDISGKLGATTVLYSNTNAVGAQRVIIVGLGSALDFDLQSIRRAAAASAAKARDLGCKTLATIVHGAGIGGITPHAAAEAMAEGMLLGEYQADLHKSVRRSKHIQAIEVIEFEAEKVTDIRNGIESGVAQAIATNKTRDLVNQPPNFCTPTYLAEQAQALAESSNLTIEILEQADLEAEQMGAFLGVTQGSDEPPKLIILKHTPDNVDPDAKPIVLVGKGITFDTGGYTMKTGAGMLTMKSDMGGAAAVFGAMQAIDALDLDVPVIGLIPTCENMISGNSYRPSDVITASNGKTIEIISTDAEGRLILADTLVYAQRLNPRVVIDLATLTGAAMVALGQGQAAALFTADSQTLQGLQAAADESGERLWHMPLYPEYSDYMRRSPIADLRNSPNDRYGGVGTSAAFLKEFVADMTWAHIDIASVAWLPNGKAVKPLGPSGATGYGVRLLTKFVRNLI